MRNRLTACFSSGGRLRSRSVSDRVLRSALDVPPLPARLRADCEREITQRGVEAGDVEALALARARLRWPQYRHCVQAVDDWQRNLGLAGMAGADSIALMACRGARYHHDGERYGGMAFCNLFLSEDRGLDLHFPYIGLRIPLHRGTAVIFDTGQPHAVIRRVSNGFSADDFPSGLDCTLLFLTWELPIEDVNLGDALGVHFDIDAPAAAQRDVAQVWCNGARGLPCPASGRWNTTAEQGQTVLPPCGLPAGG